MQRFVREAAVQRGGVVCADDAVDVDCGCGFGGRRVAVDDCYAGGVWGVVGKVIGC